MPSFKSKLLSGTMKSVKPIITGLRISEQRKGMNLLQYIHPKPKDVRIKEAEDCPLPGKWAIPQNRTPGKAVLYTHGGAYVYGSPSTHEVIISRLAEKSGVAVFAYDYRLAPEHPFPAALEDAVTAFDYLLQQGFGPRDIVLCGDSAGGGLALALCLYAKDHGLPLPAGIITMSPWTDVSLSGASYEENYTIDPLFGNSKENMLYQCSYIGNANPKNPYLSPLFGDFEGFPPMLMQVGAYEVLLDDTRAAAKKARAEGVKVRCSVYDGMFHVFQMGLDLIPESREAWEEVAEYLRIIYRIHREPEGTVVKKVKTRRKETEDRARLNLLAFLKRELKK